MNNGFNVEHFQCLKRQILNLIHYYCYYVMRDVNQLLLKLALVCPSLSYVIVCGCHGKCCLN